MPDHCVSIDGMEQRVSSLLTMIDSDVHSDRLSTYSLDISRDWYLAVQPRRRVRIRVKPNPTTYHYELSVAVFYAPRKDGDPRRLGMTGGIMQIKEVNPLLFDDIAVEIVRGVRLTMNDILHMRDLGFAPRPPSMELNPNGDGCGIDIKPKATIYNEEDPEVYRMTVSDGEDAITLLLRTRRRTLYSALLNGLRQLSRDSASGRLSMIDQRVCAVAFQRLPPRLIDLLIKSS